MTADKHSAITLHGTLDTLLQQAEIWGALDAVVAVVGPYGELLYNNQSWSIFEQHLNRVTKHTGQSTGLLASDEAQLAIKTCFSSVQSKDVSISYIIDLNFPLELHLAVRPILEAGCRNACAVLVTIADESIVFDKFRFAQLAQAKRELSDRIKSLSNELNAKEEILRALLKDTPFAIMLVASDRRVVQVNRAFETMLGLNARAVLGKTCDTFLSCYQCNEDCPILEGRHINLEETDGIHRSNSRIPLLRSSVLLAQNGEPIVMEAFVDISARKQAERERDQYRDRLEELVEERTAELNAVNRELEAFCYSVSHDLRSPLRAINGFSTVLQEDYDEVLGPDGQDYLRRIRNGTEHMGHLIDDLLQLSRVTRDDVTRTTMDLSALAKVIADKLRGENPHQRVNVTIADGLRARGDERLLRVALENLLDNAWKYTRNSDPGEIVFGITREGENPVFFIRDNGAGFDMQYANKLFGAFQRLHRASEFEGTGIGLAIVQRIIQRHGGHVWAEAAPGAGATFFFTLRG